MTHQDDLGRAPQAGDSARQQGQPQHQSGATRRPGDAAKKGAKPSRRKTR